MYELVDSRILDEDEILLLLLLLLSLLVLFLVNHKDMDRLNIVSDVSTSLSLSFLVVGARSRNGNIVPCC